MSMESAVSFYERLEKDVELQEKLKELGTKENISQYVKGELGYDFTLEEMQKVIFEKNPEMTDEELEAVVGGSVIGTEAVAKSPADGYTLLLASTATHAMAPHTSLAATFDPLADFVPITNLAWQTKVVLVSTALPVASVSEFVAYARQRPGATGAGTSF